MALLVVPRSIPTMTPLACSLMKRSRPTLRPGELLFSASELEVDLTEDEERAMLERYDKGDTLSLPAAEAKRLEAQGIVLIRRRPA
mgnify:CR=1 FL=1